MLLFGSLSANTSKQSSGDRARPYLDFTTIYRHPPLSPTPRPRANGSTLEPLFFLLPFRRLWLKRLQAVLAVTMEKTANITYDNAIGELRAREYPMLKGTLSADGLTVEMTN